MEYVQLDAFGLLTYTNELGKVPPGAMSTALNVNVNKPGVVESRRGFSVYGTYFSDTINKLFNYQDKLICHHGTTLSYDTDDAGSWQDYAGTFSPPTGEKIRSSKANKNFYFTTNNGVYKIDSVTSNPYKAGIPQGLDLQAAVTGSSGFLADQFYCAYRMTWIYTDENGNLVEGSPSMSVTVQNTSGGTRDISLTFTVPSSITTAYSYRIYRTLQSNVTPGDDFQLVAETAVTSAQVTARSVTVTDSVPDSLQGLGLYTSQNLQGQYQSNDTPPLCKDITEYLGMMFYANCSTLQQKTLTLAGVGSPNGIQIGDTITITGTSAHTYTGAAANDAGNQEFKVDTSGTTAQNIDETARNLCAMINQDTDNDEFYAYYVSGYSQLPGQIYLRTRNLSSDSFSVISDRGGAFSPSLPASGTTYSSTNDSVPNGIYVSKVNEPEAVPSTNLIFVGSGDSKILRIVALRDSVMAITEEGIYKIVGTSPSSLSINPIDNTLIGFGNETAAALQNSIFTFTSQGVAQIGESGNSIISRQIEGDLLKLSAPSVYTGFKSLAFGVGYESERQYILCIASDDSDTTSTIQYVFNWVSEAWTTWDLNVTCGFVNPTDNRLYFGASDGYILRERKTFTFQDYVDRTYNVSLIGASGVYITLESATIAQTGMSLVQGISVDGITRESIISSVNGLTLTVQDSLDWLGGSAHLATPIGSTVTFLPIHGGYPNYLKRWSPMIGFAFSSANFDEATVEVMSDLSPTLNGLSLSSPISSIGLDPTKIGNWGTFGWGTLRWPTSLGEGVPLQIIPTILPRNYIVNHWLDLSVGLRQAYRNLSLNGVATWFDIASTRFK